jgi:hypothetical protein
MSLYVDRSFFVNTAMVPFIWQPSSLVCDDKLCIFILSFAEMASQQARTQPETEMYVSIYEQEERKEKITKTDKKQKTVSDYSARC